MVLGDENERKHIRKLKRQSEGEQSYQETNHQPPEESPAIFADADYPYTGERYPDEKKRIQALQMMTVAKGREARQIRDIILADEDYNNLWKHTAIRDNYPVVVPPISDERSDETDDEKKLTTYLLKQATERQRIKKRDFEKSEDARKSIKGEEKIQFMKKNRVIPSGGKLPPLPKT